MATFLYIGDDERVFLPFDGPAIDVKPGDHVEADSNPDPHYFDEVTAGPSDGQGE